MKKNILLFVIVIFIFIFLFVAISNTGGFRGGDAFQPSTVEALKFNFESDVNPEPLFEECACTDNIYIQYFWMQETETIHCAAFEEKNQKYAYLYGFSFKPDEITEKLGLEALEVYNDCEVVYGIMPGEKESVVINKTIPSITIPFTVGDSEYKCWYALVDGGYDAVKNVAYEGDN